MNQTTPGNAKARPACVGGLYEICVGVTDLAESIAFYERFGCRAGRFGTLDAAGARALYGVDSAVRCVLLYHQDADHGLIRLIQWERPVNDGLGLDDNLRCLGRLETLNAQNLRRQAEGAWRPPVHIGLGVHTGRVAAGNIGSPDRMEYSVIGEAVNLAARLESATRKFDVDIVISPATQRLVAHRFVTEPLGKADAKGFSEQVEVYTVRGEKH